MAGQVASAGDTTAALPAEGMRCAGPVAVAGIREGNLWLIDARGTPFLIPLTHPGLRARIAAAQGDAAGAVAFAQQGGLAVGVSKGLDKGKGGWNPASLSFYAYLLYPHLVT